MKRKPIQFKLYYEEHSERVRGAIRVKRPTIIKSDRFNAVLSRLNKLVGKYYPAIIRIQKKAVAVARRIKWDYIFVALVTLTVFNYSSTPVYSAPLSNTPPAEPGLFLGSYPKQMASITYPVEPIAELPMLDFPYAPVGTYANDYAFGNCTSLAASTVHVPNSMGNANAWDDYARSVGALVSSTPKVGMVAQTDAGWAGHVATVIAVNDGTVTVEEMNYSGFNIVDTRTTPISDWTYLSF